MALKTLTQPQTTFPLFLMLGILVVFVLGIILHELRSILLPFVIAVFLSIIFSPIVVHLKRRKVPTLLALLTVLLVMALTLFLFSLVIYSTTDSFVRELPKYEQRLTSLVGGLVQQFNTWAIELNITLDDAWWKEAFQLSSITATVASGVGTFLNFLTNIFLILLFIMFMLAGSGELGAKIEHALPAKQARQMATIIENVGTQVRQYLITKTLISLGTGFITFIILVAAGVDFPLIWAFLTFLLHFIPNIGSIIAVLFPFILSLLQFDALGRPVLILILLTTVQMAIGNVLEPKVMSFNLNLSALVILVSLIFWGWLWGVWGMVLAVPIMATVKIIFENIESLRPLSVLMSENIGEQE